MMYTHIGPAFIQVRSLGIQQESSSQPRHCCSANVWWRLKRLKVLL